MTAPDPIVASPRSRLRVGLGAAVVLVLIGLGVAVLAGAFGAQGSSVTLTAPTPTAATGIPQGSGTTVYVHILGAVARPGLFLLAEGDRAVDAIVAAGGFTATADQAQLNLARPVVDGEQIYVPVLGEAPPPSATTGGADGGKVNLNTADGTALESLPRVGPAMAQRILDWRKTNGRFSAIEDLMSVTGIGEKTFEGLKDLVTV